ncbi:hypothetical protein ACFE33_05185 [Falsihalocynthiibacter sp. SS001]|uniref:hypothetical protein n=1 Tax=Falsihalocynthiibacter sp. SS001 TaxID=3349698 RepID=UPI0036D31DFB
MKKIVTSVALAALLLAPFAAQSQTKRACAPRQDVLDKLAESYGETRQSVGLGANNTVVEVFASEKSGSWTITLTTPNGFTCLMATGHAFETLEEDLAALKGEPL